MEFVTERLILRPGKASDAESLYQYANDPAALHAHSCSRTMKLHANMSDCEQAPIRQFDAISHCSLIQKSVFNNGIPR